MAVVVTVGTNSYISVADADSYFNTQLYTTSWDNAAADDKAKALIMATGKIDKIPINGTKSIYTQTLEFPRALYSGSLQARLNIVGASDYVRGRGWVIEAEVSALVKEATCQFALSLLKMGANGNKRAELQAQGVKSFSLGSLSESFTVGARDGVPTVVKQLLFKYMGSIDMS